MVRNDILIKVSGDAANADRQLKLIENDVKRINNSIMTTDRYQTRVAAKFGKWKQELGTFTGVGKFGVPGMGMLGPAAAAMVVGAGIGEAVRRMTELDTAVTDYRKTAGLSLEDTLKYKQSVLELGVSSGVSTDKILELNQATFDASKNSKFVAQDMGFLTKAFQAVGGDAQSFGTFMGKLNREWGLSGKGLESFVGGLYALGKSTGTERNLKSIMGQAGELAESVKTFYGPHATTDVLKKYMAAAMVVGPEAMQMAMRRLGSSSAAKFLQAGHIKLFTADGMRRNLTDVLAEMKTKVPANKFSQYLQQIFGKNYMPMMKLSNDLDVVNSKIKDMGELTKDAGLESDSMASSWQVLNNAFTMMADAALGPMMKDLAAEIHKIDPKDIKELGTAFGAFFKVLGAGIIMEAKLVEVWEAMAEAMGGGVSAHGTGDRLKALSSGQDERRRQFEMIGAGVKSGKYSSQQGAALTRMFQNMPAGFTGPNAEKNKRAIMQSYINKDPSLAGAAEEIAFGGSAAKSAPAVSIGDTNVQVWIDGVSKTASRTEVKRGRQMAFAGAGE